MVKRFWAAGPLACLLGCAACGEGLPASAINGYYSATSSNPIVNSLQGVWTSACTGSGPSTQSQLVFSGELFSYVVTQFSDGACTTELYQLTIGKTFSVPSGAAATAPSLQTVDQSNQMILLSSSAATANSASLCGLTDWSGSSPVVDVSGDACLGVSIPSVGATATETITLVGSSSLTYGSISFAEGV